MRSEYLENDSGGGMTDFLGSVYGFSVLNMLESIQHKGRYYVPWLSKWTGSYGAPGIPKDLVGKVGFGSAAKGLWGRGSAARQGLTKFGALQTLGSKGVSSWFTWMAWNDPIWFAMKYRVWANPVMLAVGAARFVGVGLAQQTARNLERYQYSTLGVGQFPDSQAAFTSRQRAVRAISESQLQARSAIGGEAQLLHR